MDERAAPMAREQTAYSALAPVPASADGATSPPWSLGLLVEAVARWRLAAAGGLLCGTGLVVGAWYASPPLYEAEARMLLQRSRQSSELDSGRVQFDPLGSYEYDLLNTQRDTILSRNILAEALERSELSASYAGERDPVAAVAKRIDVLTSRESWSLILRLRDPDRGRAEAGLRTLVESYQRQRQRIDQDASSEALGHLRDEVAEANRRLQANREAEESFRRANDVLIMDAEKSLPAQRLSTLSSKRGVIGEQISALLQLVDQLKAALSEPTEQRFQTLMAVEYIARNQTVAEQYAQLLALVTQRAQLGVKFLDRHPRIIEVDAQVDAKRQQLRTVVEQVVTGVLGDFRKLRAQAESLDAEIEKLRDALADYRDKVMRLQVISLQSKSLEENASLLQRRFGEEQVLARLAVPQMVLVGPPSTSAIAVNRRLLPILGSASLGALVGLLAAVFACEQANRTVRDRATARRLTRREALGGAPWAPGDGRVAEEDIAAAYAVVRARLLLAMPAAEQGMIVVVSSPTPGDGRTQVCAQLAVSLANAGLRVLLVAGDLRSPGVERYLPTGGGPGFSDLLRGDPEAVPSETELPALQVMGRGDSVGNPAELLHSRQLPLWADAVRTRWDVVLIDTPPLSVAADSLLLASIADAILPVVRCRSTTIRSMRDWSAQFSRFGDRVLGALLLDEKASGWHAHTAARMLALAALPLLGSSAELPPEPLVPARPDVVASSFNREGGRDHTTLGGRASGRTVADPQGGFRILDRAGRTVGRIRPNSAGGTDEVDAEGGLVLRSEPDHTGGSLIFAPDGSLRGRLVPNYVGGVDWYDPAGRCLGRATWGQDLVFGPEGGG